MLALLFLLQTALVNALLLSGGLARFLTSATGVLRIDTGRSFSLWPGTVQLRAVHLELLDSNVHLALELPRGRAHISLRELFRKRFVARHVTGEHFVLRLRPRFEQLPERRRAALPPLSEPQAKAEGGGKPSYQWPVRIEDTDAQYDELWVSELRYRGAARVRGGFELVPQQSVSIDPSDVELRAGSLTYGPEQRALELGSARVRAQLQQTEAEQLPEQWRERITAHVDLAGEVVDLAFLENLSPELNGLSGGRGELRLHAGAERGRWQDDFELSYTSRDVAYARGPWRGSSALALRAGPDARSSPAGGAENALPASLRIEGLQLDARGQRVARLARLQLEAELRRSFPIAPPHALALELRGLSLDRLELLPERLRIAQFHPRSAELLSARAELAWREGMASGKAEARFEDARFAIGGWSLRESGKVTLQGVRWKPEAPLHISAATADLDSVDIRHPDRDEIRSWRVSAALEDLRFSPLTRRWTADFLVSGDDARPVLALLGVHGLPPGAADFLAMPGLKVRGSVELAPQRQELRIARAESKTIDVKGRLLHVGQQNRAAFLFKAAPLSLGVVVQADGTHAKLFAGEGWLDQHLAQLTEQSE
ncbi:MAG TPA: hypothetical protein VFS67_22315 [Polyangiaceae bacterium]|nr:hypothetical protein [Polyangiaceae bacterium]